MSNDTVCVCCEKPGHNADKCKAPFRKRWPGRPAIKLTLRAKSGNSIEFTGDISDDLYEKFAVLMNEALTAAFPKDPS